MNNDHGIQLSVHDKDWAHCLLNRMRTNKPYLHDGKHYYVKGASRQGHGDSATILFTLERMEVEWAI
ncbi:hypothetical protein AB6E53_02415 [Vibrio breoganii]|uniref:Uncharacterized protein n=1 Tax=Vibrio breoganii TaxID=553239 RepID=A0AAP8SWY9_9VIBR|nr:hypothetical protein [Vibrio breoganii]PMP10242.1 hypothetical protein BCS93_11240 [Vibrio breoganii]